MAGRGPAPKTNRRRANVPVRGEWQSTPGHGWQHGDIPAPPEGVHADTVAAWGVWFRSWFAAHWTPDDLPGLEHVASLHSDCRKAFHDPFVEVTNGRGDVSYVRRPNPNTELRQMMDSYGITPKGQQDRRWAPPVPEDQPAPTADPAGRFAHLKVVDG